MRIISGEFRSRRLLSPPDSAQTRPIPDRVKEALFNLLRGHFEGAVVADVFAGTGSIGLEALSRGAASCVFVERDRMMAGVLEQNIETLGCADRARVVQTDALGSSLSARLDAPLTLLFMDPPYPLMMEPVGFKRVMTQFERLAGELAPGGFAMVRTPHPLFHDLPSGRIDPSLELETLDGPETHVYRQTAIHLYAPRSTDAETP